MHLGESYCLFFIFPVLLIQYNLKLLNFNLNSSTVAWVMDYLTSRPHGNVFDTIITNTGTPQGTVSSLFLFSLCTSDCSIEKNPTIMKILR